MGGVGRPKTSVRVGDTDGGSEEQGVREEAESGGLQGCAWDGRLLGGVEASAAAAAGLLRIPESSVGGLGGGRQWVSQSGTQLLQIFFKIRCRIMHSGNISRLSHIGLSIM